jgi:hypothetical protein
VYLHDGVPNLLSVGELTSKIRREEGVGVRPLGGAFRVSKGDTAYIFENDGRNLLVTDVSSDLYNEEVYSVETIEENERRYIKKQIMAARRVRVSASAMGAMAMADIISQIRSRRVEGIVFRLEDVVRAYEIYGQDLKAVRGKSVKRKVI